MERELFSYMADEAVCGLPFLHGVVELRDPSCGVARNSDLEA